METARGNKRVDHADLVKWFRDYRATGKPSLELCEAIQRIARGVREAFHRQSNPEDFASDCLVKVLESQSKIDLNANVFGYITNICINLARNQHAVEQREQKKLAGYYVHFHKESYEVL